jgi:hypothetical protein
MAVLAGERDGEVRPAEGIGELIDKPGHLRKILP